MHSLLPRYMRMCPEEPPREPRQVMTTSPGRSEEILIGLPQSSQLLAMLWPLGNENPLEDATSPTQLAHWHATPLR